MAIHKKKRTVKNPLFKWNPKRKKAAFLMSLGTKTYDEVSEESGINSKTLYDWRQCQDFIKEVDRLTLENELATKAGLMRLAFQAVEKKKGNIRDDRNTVLDWAEFIIKIIPEDTKKSDDKLKALTDAIMMSARDN